MERRIRSILPVGGVVLAGLIVLPGCGGGDGGRDGGPSDGPSDSPSTGTTGDLGPSGQPTGEPGMMPDVPVDPEEDLEDFERRSRNAAAAERQRATLIDELIDLPASRFTAAADLVMLIPPDDPPRLFRLDEADLEAMPPDERAEAIARYDRLARGLRELAVRAIDEAARMREAGRAEDANDLLRRVHGLAAASGGDGVAEIGRDAARAVVVAIEEALAPGE